MTDAAIEESSDSPKAGKAPLLVGLALAALGGDGLLGLLGAAAAVLCLSDAEAQTEGQGREQRDQIPHGPSFGLGAGGRVRPA